MDKNVYLPRYLINGVKPLKNNFPKRSNLLVFDTETESRVTGEPYLLTFYDGNKPVYLRVNKDTILTEFMKYLAQHCWRKQSNIVFAHNLQFDLTAVLCKKEFTIFKWLKPPTIEVSNKAEYLGTIEIFPQKTWFAQIKLKNKANVKLVDSGNFIRGSLYQISRSLDLPHKKETKPKWLGRKPENQSEWKELIRYCRAEIKAEYTLAKYILNIHKEYDVQYSVSIAQLGSRVFRKYFLKNPIPQAPPHIRKISELCIHGGRAESFVKTPIVIPDVKMYDYNSFYPWAMVNLPPITKGYWEKVDKFVKDYEGFYRVSGKVVNCKYPVIIKSSSRFNYANDQYVRSIPIPSYELREALRLKEIELDEINGWIWLPKEEASNPFGDYIHHFYKLKNESRNNFPLYTQNKLLLNSLYGKTYQAIRKTDYEEAPEYVRNERTGRLIKNRILYRAGGLYLPHVGAWITSLCRAKLHKDMHKYEAIDCVTDSFKTKQKVSVNNQLGGLKPVCEGLLLIIRPKLYVMFSTRIQNDVERVGDLRSYLKQVSIDSLRNGQDLVKVALHGFWGNIYDLLKLFCEEKTGYSCQHMTKIRESIRQRKAPRVMEAQHKHIRANWEDEVGLCGLKKKEAIKKMEMCCDNCFLCAYRK